jgi:hypothetical protein
MSTSPAPIGCKDDGLELEGNVLDPSPVVVTLLRTDKPQWRDFHGLRCARPADVFFSLLALAAHPSAYTARRSRRDRGGGPYASARRFVFARRVNQAV